MPRKQTIEDGRKKNLFLGSPARKHIRELQKALTPEGAPREVSESFVVSKALEFSTENVEQLKTEFP